MLTSEAQLHFTLEHSEHFLEVVTVGRRAAAGRDVHVDEGVFAGGVVASHKDRIGIADKAEMRKALVLVGSSDGEVSVRVVGRKGPFI
jgi:hypothetical protein